MLGQRLSGRGVQLTRNDGIWAAAIGAIWILAGADFVSPRMPPDNVAVLWLPNAVLAVAMLRRIDKPLLLLFFAVVAIGGAAIPGALRVNEASLGWSLLAVGNAVECFALAWMANRFGGPAFAFSRPRNVALWAGAAICASALSMLMGWMGGNAGLAPVDFSAPIPAAMNWILSDSCAHLTLGALLVAATSAGADKEIAKLRREAPRAATIAAAIVLSAVLAFAGPRLWDGGEEAAHPGFLGLLLPALVWPRSATGRWPPRGRRCSRSHQGWRCRSAAGVRLRRKDRRPRAICRF